VEGVMTPCVHAASHHQWQSRFCLLAWPP